MPWNSFNENVKDPYNKNYKMLLTNTEENLNIVLWQQCQYFSNQFVSQYTFNKNLNKILLEFDIIILMFTERIIRYKQQRKC